MVLRIRDYNPETACSACARMRSSPGRRTCVSRSVACWISAGHSASHSPRGASPCGPITNSTVQDTRFWAHADIAFPSAGRFLRFGRRLARAHCQLLIWCSVIAGSLIAVGCFLGLAVGRGPALRPSSTSRPSRSPVTVPAPEPRTETLIAAVLPILPQLVPAREPAVPTGPQPTPVVPPVAAPQGTTHLFGGCRLSRGRNAELRHPRYLPGQPGRRGEAGPGQSEAGVPAARLRQLRGTPVHLKQRRGASV